MILVLPFDKLRASFQNPAKTTFCLTLHPMLPSTSFRVISMGLLIINSIDLLSSTWFFAFAYLS
ncbi:MAG: hypothetical protein DRJ05_17370 [Bacteroidetes bacterium]|nr:MAG: hypothetical protein DRJ05_17370 [Bacteroidota bacterium]